MIYCIGLPVCIELIYYFCKKIVIMTGKFHCKSCDNIFEAEGIKKEYTDPVFGPCSSYYANCPDCAGESKEYFRPKPQKNQGREVPPCGNPNMTCCCN